MDVLVVAASGVALVLVTILVLRLHPLLGLLLGSLFVLAATPREVLITSELAPGAVEVVGFGPGGLVGTVAGKATPKMGITTGITTGRGEFYFLSQVLEDSPATPLRLEPAAEEQLLAAAARGELRGSATAWWTVPAGSPALTKGDQLIAVAAVEQFQTQRWRRLGDKLAAGFAGTFLKLGIPVTMAAIVGVCLLESGAAARLVAAIMAVFGPRGTAPALTLSGFILGVPVFFDNVFYLLLPLAKAVGRQRPAAYVSAVMAIIVGATMAHSLVPPTPGPLLVAAAMQVSVGLMMIGGFIVGGLAAVVGFTYGMLCSRWIHLAPDGANLPAAAGAGELASGSAPPPPRRLPLLLAAMPIAIPILILGGAEIVNHFAAGTNAPIWLQQVQAGLEIIKDPGLIFIGTALLAIGLLRYAGRGVGVAAAVSRGITDAGTIVLLTCAGGAFGAALQQLDLATAIGQRFSGLTSPWGMLWTAFILTAIIRGAQGSATVAMITSAAIVAPVMQSISLPFHPLYLALAIGCGSKPLPWMNDSGFWQVATMTGMSTTQTLRSFSVALTLMGITGFGITLLGAWLWPLV